MNWKPPLKYLVRNGQPVTDGEEVPLNEEAVIGTTYKIPAAPGGSNSEWDLSTVPYDQLLRALREAKPTIKNQQTLLMHHTMSILNIIAPGWSEEAHMSATPKRFADQLKELTTPEPFTFTTFPATSDEMVVLGPIPFYTYCAHHVIPFYGQGFIGYVPDKLIAGLSKFPRLVKNIAKGLWVQEDLTASIASQLEHHLQPRGVAVMLEGEHMCMSMRGVQTPGTITTTSSMRGVFGDHDRTAKAEFLQIITPRRKSNG